MMQARRLSVGRNPWLQASRGDARTVQTALGDRLLEPVRCLPEKLAEWDSALQRYHEPRGGGAQSQIPLEVLNPVNRLSWPVPNPGMAEEELAFQEFIAQRFTHHDGLAHKNVYYLNGTLNLSRLREMQTFYLRIKRNAEKTHFIRKFEDLVEAYSTNFDKATSSCYARLRDMPLIVESFNDAACPFNHAEDCDTVLCVASNTVLWFDGRRYFETIESHGKERPRLQLTVSHMYAPSMIKARFTVEPLTTDERNDPAKLTQNYSDVIKKAVENA